MKPIAIRLQGIGKEYRLGSRRERDKTLGETLTHAVARPFRRLGSLVRGGGFGKAGPNGTIWALKDVSLEIEQGEVFGLIGRNGAGKSTLLKVLSRITEPTTGFAEIRGRVGALLEVGTGFHFELTGRENIYLNGAILGMRRMEIDRKFDEIVSFAEVERFIDTPVKHYSSGMFLRLAFAVAAHLEPEILLVDEVLAVGDARFQRKCLNKMEEVGQEGRTVLFVSHNVAAITRLCSRVVLLDEGKVLLDGPAREVVGTYLSMGLGTSAEREWVEPASAPGGEVVRLRAVRVRTDDGSVGENVDVRRPVSVEMEYDILRSGHFLSLYYDFYTDEGVMAFSSIDLDPTWRQRRRPAGRYVSTVWIPGNLLSAGTVFVTVGGRTMEPIVPQFLVRDAVAFHVVDSVEGDSARGDWVGEWQGVVSPRLEWSTRFTPEGRFDSEATEKSGRTSE